MDSYSIGKIERNFKRFTNMLAYYLNVAKSIRRTSNSHIFISSPIVNNFNYLYPRSSRHSPNAIDLIGATWTLHFPT